MSRISWNNEGQRFFESGVDRGVLYVNEFGVAWSGLVSVTESPTGGDPKPLYIDAVKYLNLQQAEEFEATLIALGSPPEFNRCDGTDEIHNGLFVTQQPRKPFGFSYRTLVGNDIDGMDHAYKIHIVYGAHAAPTERQYQTIGDSSEPIQLSWAITTLPPRVPGFKPTAHFVIDSRKTPRGLLLEIEDILYGGVSTNARLPTAIELMGIFQSQGPVSRRNLAVDPQPVLVDGASGPSIALVEAPWDASRLALMSTADGTTTQHIFSRPIGVGVTGETFTVSATVQLPVGLYYRAAVHVRTSNRYYYSGPTSPTPLDGASFRMYATGVLEEDAPDVDVALLVYPNESGGVTAAGSVAYLGDVLVEKTDVVNPYFDGDTLDAGGYFYNWEGEPNASPSVINTWN